MTNENNKPPLFLATLLGGIFGIIVVFCFTVWCVQDLWNYTLPSIFKVREITYFEAMRLNLLVHLLFSSAKLWNSK